MDGIRLIACCLDLESVGHFREINVEDLVEEERTVYDFVRDHLRRHGSLPATDTVAAECDVDIPATPEPYTFYQRKVHDRAVYNRVRPVFAELRQALMETDAEQVSATIATLSSAARTARSAEAYSTIIDSALQARRDYEEQHRVHTEGITGVPSGWLPLDNDTGGYRRGDLVTFVGRTGMGKTYILLQQAMSAWIHGARLLVLSLEMPVAQITNRLVGMVGGINPRFIRRGMLSPWGERRLQQGVQRLNQESGERFFLFAGGFGGSTTELDDLIAETQPEIIFIDGIYLLRGKDFRKSASRWENQAGVLDDLKSIALERNLPLVVTTQFSRQAGKQGTRGSLENIAQTGAVETHSSLVYAIKPWQRHERNAVNRDVRERDFRVIETLKGREGETAAFVINYSFNPPNFDWNPDMLVGAPSTADVRRNLDWQEGRTRGS